MSMKIKSILSLVVMLCSFSAFSQNKTMKKAETALTNKEYSSVLSLVDKAMAKDKTLEKKSRPFMMKSIANYYLSKDDKFVRKHPSAFRDAVKLAAKSLEKKGGEIEKQKNIEYLSVLVAQSRIEADASFYQKRYGKALDLYKTGFALSNDTLSWAMVGECYLFMEQTREALEVFKTVVNWNYNSFIENTHQKTYSVAPFDYLSKYYFDVLQYDSSRIYNEMGLEMFPKYKNLRTINYELLKDELNQTPFSDQYLGICSKALERFQADSFFVFSQNKAQLYLMRTAIVNNTVNTDSLFEVWAKEKVARFKSPLKPDFAKSDRFISPDIKAALTKLVGYFVEFGHVQSAATAYIYTNFLKSGIKPTTLQNYIEFIRLNQDSIKVSLGLAIYSKAEKLFGADKKLIAQKLTYLKNKLKNTLNFDDLISLENESKSNLTAFSKDKDIALLTKGMRMRLAQQALALKNMSVAWKTYWKMVSEYGESAETDSLNKKLVIVDFNENYFGTRIETIADDNKSGKFEWNGNLTECNPGTISAEIQTKMQNRLNYFRRNAGVMDEIQMAKELSEKCQQAATVMEAGHTLMHEIPDYSKCYTAYAAQAAQNSVMSLGLLGRVKWDTLNTMKALTQIFTDNSASCGNRRNLLNTKAKFMGHGSTTHATVIWTSDLHGNADTSIYMKHPITWPSAGYMPVFFMPQTKKWSFSVFENLKDATVSITHSTAGEVVVKTEPFVDGYAVPALVFEPSITKEMLNSGTYFTVNVKLKSGTKYQYKVKMLQVAVK